MLRQEHSILTGRVALDTKPDPVKLVIHLRSPQVDLDSLSHVVDLDGTGSGSGPERRRAMLATMDTVVKRAIKMVQGELVLKTDLVRWKGETFGRGLLRITAKNRRLSIERLELEPSGGKILLRNAIWPVGGGLGSSLDMEVRNFSYGFLTRETPGSPMRSQGGVVPAAVPDRPGPQGERTSGQGRRVVPGGCVAQGPRDRLF